MTRIGLPIVFRNWGSYRQAYIGAAGHENRGEVVLSVFRAGTRGGFEGSIHLYSGPGQSVSIGYVDRMVGTGAKWAVIGRLEELLAKHIEGSK